MVWSYPATKEVSVFWITLLRFIVRGEDHEWIWDFIFGDSTTAEMNYCELLNLINGITDLYYFDGSKVQTLYPVVFSTYKKYSIWPQYFYTVIISMCIWLKIEIKKGEVNVYTFKKEEICDEVIHLCHPHHHSFSVLKFFGSIPLSLSLHSVSVQMISKEIWIFVLATLLYLEHRIN